MKKLQFVSARTPFLMTFSKGFFLRVFKMCGKGIIVINFSPLSGWILASLYGNFDHSYGPKVGQICQCFIFSFLIYIPLA